MRIHRIRAALVAMTLISVSALIGCGSATVQEMLPDQTLAYKKSREASENLELPPDLRSGSFDDALDVPPIDGGATYSEYASGRTQRSRAAASGDVLPSVANVELRRDGQQRWLEVDASAQQVWPQVIAFWRQQGILLTKQDPGIGIMQTDWVENRAEIPQDFITRMVRKVADGLYATSTRDQFTVRLDRGPRAGVTEVYLDHKGMVERIVEGTLGDAKRTVWEPSGTDPVKESEMLRRLMLFLGASQQEAGRAVAGGSTASRTGTADVARLVTDGAAPAILIDEEFRAGWRITGSALDRAGFSVEDRDLSRGTYYVRYQDADAPRRNERRTLGDRLAFWRGSGIDEVKQYRVQVDADGERTRVSVRDSAGNPDGSPAAQRILALLTEQMN